MTFAECIQPLVDGKRVRRRSWPQDVVLLMHGQTLVLDNGHNIHTANVAMSWLTADDFEIEE
jgi:folylpolyglutamate synthase/dihydropteroate synthase